MYNVHGHVQPLPVLPVQSLLPQEGQSATMLVMGPGGELWSRCAARIVEFRMYGSQSPMKEVVMVTMCSLLVCLRY